MNQVILEKISEFVTEKTALKDLAVNYWYEGYCPQSGEFLRLPRNRMIEAIALGLMKQLAEDNRYSYEGKMYGVLLVETPQGELAVLKAFSGLLLGKNVVEGWVPSLLGKEKITLEEIQTLEQLENLKHQIVALQKISERQDYQDLSKEWKTRLNNLAIIHRERKLKRQEKRKNLLKTFQDNDLKLVLDNLNKESQKDGIEKRKLKQKRDKILNPLKQKIDQADAQILELKQQRKELSRQLQAQMNQVYSLSNFAGQSNSLQSLIPTGGLLTGTGECCAPKLLNYAAQHHLKPLAMAEFWWGEASNNGDKIPGQFYPACQERCQPLMGFLLSGLGNNQSFFKSEIKVIYEDQWIIAIDKPSGLLSVPGRYFETFDSVLTRLQNSLPDAQELRTVHRLDQDTSGILLLARDRYTHRHLSQQFAQRKVEKIYEAILAGSVMMNEGVIQLPLWGDPNNRPYQKVDWELGKPSITQFKVITTQENLTRIQFIPLTGRTHQIRVHAVDTQGLGSVILGDYLYGCNAGVSRLHLHARELKFEHPQQQKTVHLYLETPF